MNACIYKFNRRMVLNLSHTVVVRGWVTWGWVFNNLKNYNFVIYNLLTRTYEEITTTSH